MRSAVGVTWLEGQWMGAGPDYEARFDRARMKGCICTRASFVETRFYAIEAPGMNMERASLTNVRIGDGADLSGTNFRHVDAVGAAVMEFKPEELEQLHLAGKKGYNSEDLDGINYYTWVRGNEIDQVRRAYSKPTGWKPYSSGS